MTNKNTWAYAFLVAALLSGCESDSTSTQASPASEPQAPAEQAAKDLDNDGVADSEDAEPLDPEVSARSSTKYSDDAGNLIGTGTFDIRSDGKITAEENVYLNGEFTDFRAEIAYTDSGEIASISIDDEIDGSVDFRVSYAYEGGNLVRQTHSGAEKFEFQSDPQSGQQLSTRDYVNQTVASTRVLRREGRVDFTYNSSNLMTSQRTDFSSNGLFENSALLEYDSAGRLIDFELIVNDPMSGTDTRIATANIYEGDNDQPLSRLVVTPKGVLIEQLSVDETSELTTVTSSVALADSGLVPVNQAAQDLVSTFGTQLIRDQLSAAGLSGTDNFLDLLYRSTNSGGATATDSLTFEPLAAVYITNDRGQLVSRGLDIDQDGQIELFEEQNSYNDLGFITRSEVSTQFDGPVITPAQLVVVRYGAYGPVSGSLSLGDGVQSAAEFTANYNSDGYISSYDLDAGDLVNLSLYASLSSSYEGSSQIDPVELNRFVTGLSEQDSYKYLFRLVIPTTTVPEDGGEIGGPVIELPDAGGPDLPQVPVGGCPGGLSFC